MKYVTNISKEKTLVNHTNIPITTPAANFIHVMIAGVKDNINIAGVAENTTNTHNINLSELAEISKDKPSKTLVEFVDNNIQAKKPEENTITSSKRTYN
jgi:hypothetical protein